MKNNSKVETYSIEIFDNHIIAKISNTKVLIDTGSPQSFGHIHTIRLLNREFKIKSNLMNVSTSEISDLMGTDVDVILGMDILKSMNFFISKNEKK